MTDSSVFFNMPFGAASCETEMKQVGSDYPQYYFRHAPFNEIALDPDNYLFIGRRGAGKSSLAHYFTFQKKLKNARAIDVNEPKVYEDVLNKLAQHAGTTSIAANPRIVAIWNYILWELIFAEYSHEDEYIATTHTIASDSEGWCSLIKRLIRSVLNRFLDDDGFSADLEEALLYLFTRKKQGCAFCGGRLAFRNHGWRRRTTV